MFSPAGRLHFQLGADNQAQSDPRAVPASLSYIGEIERQAKNPKIAVLCTIAMALDIAPATLFC